MYARIYRPSRTAMQSGKAKFDRWVLEFERQTPKRVDPLMGWTSSDDTLADEVRLTFETKEAAIAYAKENGIPFSLSEDEGAKPTIKAYSDNFAARRRMPWTH